MGVSAKLDADVGSFISNINSAKTQVKTLDAEIKKIDATFKATGNAEEQLANKTQALNNKLQQQKTIVSQYEKAMDQMAKSGVDPASDAYQKMAQQMLTAQAAMMQTQSELNALDGSQQKAASSADKLGKSVGDIGKKLSLDQVITGIDKITGAMEAAAQKAIHFGEQLFNSIMESAQWADDTESMAKMYGIDLETFQRMQKLVTNGMDTSVEAIIKSQQKLNLNVGKGAKETMDTLKELGLIVSSGKGQEVMVTDDSVDLFWQAGKAIMAMGNSFDQEAAAMSLFGKSWHELIPLFSEFENRTDYEKALSEVNIVSEESVENLATLADKIGELEGNFQSLKNEVFGALAPALTEAAEALSGLLTAVLEYLKTPEGQKALEDMGTAVSGLFDDLGKIDPEQVVQGFKGVFDTIVGSIQWLVDNKDSVVAALEAIVIGWGALKLTGGALEILKLINGLQGLTGGGGTGGGRPTAGGSPTVAGTGAAAGGSGIIKTIGSKIGTFISSAAKTAPFALPGILAVDSFIHMQNVFAEGNKAAAEEAQRIEQKTQQMDAEGAFGTDGYRELWDMINAGYTQGTVNPLASFAGRYKAWWYEGAQDAMMDELATILDGGDKEEIWNQFQTVMETWLAGGQFYGTEVQDLYEQMRSAIEAAGENNKVKIPSELTLPDGEAEALAQQVGTVVIPAQLVPTGDVPGKANGMWAVPYDGYLALLHKNERIMPAREYSSRTYSSNLYVENMNMSGGADAAGLASAMAAAQRRTMSGYGSG